MMDRRQRVSRLAVIGVISLWATASRLRIPATRLTQQHRREAKAGTPLPPDVPTPRYATICRGCGKLIRDGRRHCAQCAVEHATERLIDAARIGRADGHTLEARSREGEKQCQHALARSSWKLSNLPSCLTAEVYSEKIQPLLSGISNSTIAAALGVSRWYAGRMRKGYRPHPRHTARC
jgi:hypothetical protein